MLNSIQEIINNLNQQPSWVIYDIRTFQYLRNNRAKMIASQNLGAGNLLSVLGLLSVLNHFSKVYYVLSTGNIPDKFKTKGFKENDSFVKLILQYRTHFLGPIQSPKYLKEIWDIFRNGLSHRAQIESGNQAAVLISNKKISLKSFIRQAESEGRNSFIRFSTKSKAYMCIVDKLIGDTEAIRDRIIEDLTTKKFSDENIKATFKWLTKT